MASGLAWCLNCPKGARPHSDGSNLTWGPTGLARVCSAYAITQLWSQLSTSARHGIRRWQDYCAPLHSRQRLWISQSGLSISPGCKTHLPMPCPGNLPVFFSQPPRLPSTCHCASRAEITGFQQVPTVDNAELDEAVELFMARSIAPSTSSSYRSAQRRYLGFCSRFGISQPYHLQENTLGTFVAFLARDGQNHRSIKAYLSGLRFLQIKLALGNPFTDGAMPRLKYVLKGIKRMESQSGTQGRVRLPITIAQTQRHLAARPSGSGPSDAVGSCMRWILQVPTGRRVHRAIGAGIRPGDTSEPGGPVHRQPLQPLCSLHPHQAEQNRPFSPRATLEPTWYIT